MATKAKSQKLRRPIGYKRVLGFENAKTVKGQKRGFLTGIIYLAPATEASTAERIINVCTNASPVCIKGCLNRAGRASFDKRIPTARIRKTHRLFDNRALFLECLRHDIRLAIRRAKRMRLKLAIRPNGTSDLPWLAHLIAKEFPTVTFYDYTKHPRAWERILPNYHLTFSHSEINHDECLRALAHGINIAVVFDTKKGKHLPAEFLGRPVIDGDLHDLRFLEGYQSAIIGLRAKGPAKKNCDGFVITSSHLVQIQAAA